MSFVMVLLYTECHMSVSLALSTAFNTLMTISTHLLNNWMDKLQAATPCL